MSRNVIQFPEPPVDRVEAYLALLECGVEVADARLAELRELMSADERTRLVAKLRAEGAALTRRANALEAQMRAWRRDGAKK
jgi:hypothetical protein